MAKVDTNRMVDLTKPFYLRCLGIMAYLEGNQDVARRHLEEALGFLEARKGLPYRDARDQGGQDLLILLPFVATSKAVIGSVGDDKLKGTMSTDNTKDPSDPAWADDPAVKDYLAWVDKYVPAQDRLSDKSSALGYVSAQTLVEVLKRAGNELTRANIMKIATSLDGLSLPLLLPGITLHTSADNYFPITSLQIKRFDGARWQLIGKPIQAE